jgi:hypothetical protein
MPSLATLLCTHCEAAGLELQAGGQVLCRYCGTANVLDGVVCAHCEHTNLPGAETCGNCRQSLERACPNCGARNWAGAETCGNCAASLDTVSLMKPRLGVNPADRFNEQQRSSRSLKEQEAQSADRRTAEFRAMEARRQANIAAAQQKKSAEQRMMLIGVAAVAIVIVVILIVSVLLTSLR